MKGKYLIAIAFLASWTVITANKLPSIFEAEDQCPAIDNCPPKLISHETDCTKYYECKTGVKQLRSCAAGLYFSQRWRGCVNRAISDCAIPPTNPTSPTPTPEPGQCMNGDLLRHECECTKFYECKDGRKALRDCPTGQFNPATKTCEVGYDCNDETTPTTIPLCVEGTFSPHECQCEKYYECKNNRKALRECEAGKYFDKTKLICVTGDCNKPINCENGDAKKHHCDCDKYYKCTNGDWYLEYCGSDLHFNERTKTCTNPVDAGCDKTIGPGYCANSSPSKWPHECDCRLYYQCESGKKIIYDCSWGFYFDKVNLKCDVAANVAKDCKNSWDGWV